MSVTKSEMIIKIAIMKTKKDVIEIDLGLRDIFRQIRHEYAYLQSTVCFLST